MFTVVPSIKGNRSLWTPSLETSPPTPICSCLRFLSISSRKDYSIIFCRKSLLLLLFYPVQLVYLTHHLSKSHETLLRSFSFFFSCVPHRFSKHFSNINHSYICSRHTRYLKGCLLISSTIADSYFYLVVIQITIS